MNLTYDFTLTTIGIFLSVIGVIIGYMTFTPPIRKSLIVICVSIYRIMLKSTQRLIYPDSSISRIIKDQIYQTLPNKTQITLIDKRAILIAQKFKERLQIQFGSDLTNVYVFGSRVRGDYSLYSDLDIAIFLSNTVDKKYKKLDLLSHIRELLDRYGIYIQPHLFDNSFLTNPEMSSDGFLIKAILDYGIIV